MLEMYPKASFHRYIRSAFSAQTISIHGEGACGKGQDLLYLFSRPFHTAFQPQGDDGHDIGQAVKKGWRRHVFLLVDFVQGFDEGLSKVRMTATVRMPAYG